MRNRKAFYWTDAAEWIAQNDGAGDDDAMSIEDCAALTTVCMIADLTGVSQETIARRIVEHRRIWAEGRNLPIQHLSK